MVSALDKIGKKKTEDITRGIELFEYLMERAEIGPGDTVFLRQLLIDIGQQTVAEIIDNYEREASIAKLPDETEQVKISCATDVLVDQLGKKWMQYGRKLGISDSKLEGIQEKHPRNLEEQVRELLREWKKTRKAEARVDDLLKALRACSQNYTADLVEKKLQNLCMQ
ncbi:FAS-associated death domain protein isoform X2 [Electrophorus electricus]|uniref:FAS-associated death domain protein isoform X2 n=1 Tax=Electrophorus electricus TaxID=8005 RepID=UPI000F0A3C4E|nr:FAS-associated death domain protein isoform X2 [Electrophorus electricus]